METPQERVDRLRSAAELEHLRSRGRNSDHYVKERSDQRVYMISNHIGMFKVGRATDPVRRCYDLQSGSPHILRLVHSFEAPHSKAIEKALHQLFVDSKIRGEWFTLSKSEAHFFRSLTTLNHEQCIKLAIERKKALA